eukprot:3807507-Rhodomonas_salina.1
MRRGTALRETLHDKIRLKQLFLTRTATTSLQVETSHVMRRYQYLNEDGRSLPMWAIFAREEAVMDGIGDSRTEDFREASFRVPRPII